MSLRKKVNEQQPDDDYFSEAVGLLVFTFLMGATVGLALALWAS